MGGRDDVARRGEGREGREDRHRDRDRDRRGERGGRDRGVRDGDDGRGSRRRDGGGDRPRRSRSRGHHRSSSHHQRDERDRRDLGRDRRPDRVQDKYDPEQRRRDRGSPRLERPRRDGEVGGVARPRRAAPAAAPPPARRDGGSVAGSGSSRGSHQRGSGDEGPAARKPYKAVRTPEEGSDAEEGSTGGWDLTDSEQGSEGGAVRTPAKTLPQDPRERMRMRKKEVGGRCLVVLAGSFVSLLVGGPCTRSAC